MMRSEIAYVDKGNVYAWKKLGTSKKKVLYFVFFCNLCR